MTARTSLMIASLFIALPVAALAETAAAYVAKAAAARIVPVVKQHIDVLNGDEHQNH